MRISVRVTPGAPRERVGGRYDAGLLGAGSAPGAADVLAVRVTARAVDGKATAAVLAAVAKAFGVPKRAVTLASGATSRLKILDVDGPEEELTTRYAALLGR